MSLKPATAIKNGTNAIKSLEKAAQNNAFKDKIVFIRCDLNVPTKAGKVTDDTRITRLLPTLKYCLKMGKKVILASHFGRPEGKVNPEFSLKFLLPVFESLLGQPLEFINQYKDANPKATISASSARLFLLENLRFDPGEEKNDDLFAQKLAKLADIYVNDAFSAAHRAHASIERITHYLPSYAGFLMQEELSALNIALENPQRPLAAIVGGAKISTKLDLLNNMVTKVDYLILGGGMANTFLYAQGHSVGASLCEKDMKPQALNILETAKKQGCEIILPIDYTTAKEFKENTPSETKTLQNLAADDMILDIGPQSQNEVIKPILRKCKTLVWNGPFGAFEIKPFDAATVNLARFVAELTKAGTLISVAGGGDTVSALNQAGISDQFSYLSSAGGAFLEWLEGKKLPGVLPLLS